VKNITGRFLVSQPYLYARTADNRIHCIDANTGTNQGNIDALPGAWAGEDRFMYVCSANYKVYCLRLSDNNEVIK
jgi:hypothetical protein